MWFKYLGSPNKSAKHLLLAMFVQACPFRVAKDQCQIFSVNNTSNDPLSLQREQSIQMPMFSRRKGQKWSRPSLNSR